jgi:hypothetical protein
LFGEGSPATGIVGSIFNGTSQGQIISIDDSIDEGVIIISSSYNCTYIYCNNTELVSYVTPDCEVSTTTALTTSIEITSSSQPSTTTKVSTCDLTSLGTGYINAGNCTSKYPVDLEKCAGSCATEESGDIDIDFGSDLVFDSFHIRPKYCACCNVDQSYQDTIIMVCDNNGVLEDRNATYHRIQSCICNVCRNNIE